MALHRQTGGRNSKVSGHFQFPELPKVFAGKYAENQSKLDAWYAELQLALLAKLDELAAEIQVLKD